MKIGSRYSPWRSISFPPALFIQEPIPKIPWICQGDVIPIYGSKAGIIGGLMKYLGIGRCPDGDRTMSPDTRPLFRVIPEGQTSPLVDIIDQFLEWCNTLITFIGAKEGTSEGIEIDNGQD